ncbi:anaerobic sulfatase maturase [Tessaracoccus antarcticus]|uniref:Anaerobic sulfatase maturase n=1 Tax=Tessaracoccus antarcticus TaxID=2479848 RepID=A0A3M0GIZ7_9ACTN|nr:anaerobic sulfatase maturase [Tessaracoccus antarcticus]RMB61593.1 anaerobic sulfatase maturase [Tessaracoccus antarcticus]
MRRDLPFSVVTKPTGAACNLDCTYCFFLSKELLYDADGQRMSEATLRALIANQLDSQPDGDVMLVWQGGEPTMRGLAFYREAVRLGNELTRPQQVVQHSMQTNGTLLDDDWCEFLAAENFLVGLSVDGPENLHDAYRVNKAGRGTHTRVVRGWELLRKHSVDTNVLCTVNAANAEHGAEVYRWFRDELGATFLQFIPIVERVPAADLATAEQGWIGPDGARLLYRQAGNAVTSRSVTGEQWGRFLCEVFDEWRARDVGRVFVQHFDTMLAARFGQYSLCVHAPECGTALAVEHNGDIYSCDHYVEPGFELGNIHTDRLAEVLVSDQQGKFGRSKRTALTAQCRRCPVRWACHGGCPKDRFATSLDGEAGQNFLCEGYYGFFTHATEGMEQMAALLQAGRAPAEVMATHAMTAQRS